MEIIAFINQKGGVGKTTSAINLADNLSHLKFRTLIVDLDPQGNTTFNYLQDSENVKFIDEIFISQTKTNILPFIKQVTDFLDILPSNIKLAVAAENITGRVHREKILAKHLKQIEERYDYIIIDCPPNLGSLAINGIYAANRFIIPIDYSRYALDGMGDLLQRIIEVKEMPECKYYVLRNKYDVRNKTTNEFIESILQKTAINLLNTRIRKSEAINQAQINNQSLFMFEKSGSGVEDFARLATEILEICHGKKESA